jgi:ATP-dependent helicase/nuclease subunit A
MEGKGADLLEKGSRLVKIRRIPTAQMKLAGLGEQLALARLERDLEEAGREEVPGEERKARILDQILADYPHKDLEGLYAKVSVSELKMAAIHGTHPGAGEEPAGEGEISLFPEPARPCIPAFAREDREETRSGTGYGTAVHRLMELLDYERFADPDGTGQEEILAWKEEMIESGKFSGEDASLVHPGLILDFLRSSLGRRMGRAQRAGLLRREQPFVLGLPASAMDRAYPETETVMIQGIIDAFFEEEGKIILVDYKTDRVETGAELAGRYKVQMDYYAAAIERLTHKKVAQRILYSFRLREEVLV